MHGDVEVVLGTPFHAHTLPFLLQESTQEQGQAALCLSQPQAESCSLSSSNAPRRQVCFGLHHACMRMLRWWLAHHVIHTLPFLLQESTQEQTRTSSLGVYACHSLRQNPGAFRAATLREDKCGFHHACMRMLRSCLAHHVMHTLPFLLQESTQEQHKDKQPCACQSLRQNPVACLAATLREDKCALAFTMHACNAWGC